jgi:putative transposase
MSDDSFSKRRAKYGGMEISEAKRLKELEAENRRLKWIVADQALDIQMLKDVKKMLRYSNNRIRNVAYAIGLL